MTIWGRWRPRCLPIRLARDHELFWRPFAPAAPGLGVVRDAFHPPRLVPINTNPDGSVAADRIVDGVTWAVTNTFRF